MNRFRARLTAYLQRTLMAFVVFTLCRILFYGFNAGQFANLGIDEFLMGLRFDGAAFFYLFLPFNVLSLVALLVPVNKLYDQIIKWSFLASNAINVMLNCIDIEYYKFTLKRTTSDIFSLVTYGDDIYTLIPRFLVDYWYIDLIFIILVYLSFVVYGKTEREPREGQSPNWFIRVGITLSILAALIVMGRGGTQLIPIGIMDAAKNTQPQNVPLVLNTPFAIIRTLDKTGLEPVDYYTLDEVDDWYHPITTFPNGKGEFRPKNVVVIVLESFSNEFIYRDKTQKKLTPFLSKLMAKSRVFTRCYANGKKSIEGIPAIVSGIPSLMNTPFISSTYAGDEFSSLASYLNPKGYHSSFFHGGKNGTMNFDAYAAAADFQHYYGMNEYPNHGDYDGTWGIYDEPFFQFYAQELEEFPEPFVSVFFSLSSHHPYSIPEQYQQRFIGGKTPLENTVQYTDFALEQFFIKAQQSDWYENTLFIITADHTSDSKNKYYRNSLGMYHIPLIAYYPDGSLSGSSNRVTQQTDILPSVLDWLHYDQPIFSFGQSIFTDNPGYSTQFINEVHQLITDEYLLQYSDEKVVGFFDITSDTLLKNNLVQETSPMKDSLEMEIKAIIQQYNNRMIYNKLSAE
ncbi:sulfatase-like hydrolase/transferase [bacterium SCSIO 12741]|nr:sulfatase-like hydrolase/transferase [bacterium SCSIO 12741]